MKNRIKWMLVGLGFTFGIQVLISMVFTAIAYGVARSRVDVPQGTASIVVFGFTLGAFLVGGIVVGWTNEKLRVPDGIIMAIATLALSAIVYWALPSTNRGQFVSGTWLSDDSGAFALTGRSGIFAVLATAASAIGAYIGWHMKVPAEGAFDRVALLIGLLGAIVGPFILLAIGGRDPNNPSQPGLPWYFLAIVLVLVLVIIGVGFMMFARDSKESEEISISPDHRKDS